MELVFGNEYIISNIDSLLSMQDIVNLQSVNKTLNTSLYYRKTKDRPLFTKQKFIQKLHTEIYKYDSYICKKRKRKILLY